MTAPEVPRACPAPVAAALPVAVATIFPFGPGGPMAIGFSPAICESLAPTFGASNARARLGGQGSVHGHSVASSSAWARKGPGARWDYLLRVRRPYQSSCWEASWRCVPDVRRCKLVIDRRGAGGTGRRYKCHGGRSLRSHRYPWDIHLHPPPSASMLLCPPMPPKPTSRHLGRPRHPESRVSLFLAPADEAAVA